jgi:transposase
MGIIEQVQGVWKGLSKRTRRWLNSESMVSADAGWRMRCKTVRNLVRGEEPSTIARLLGCSRSHVYRVARRFLEGGPEGLVDRREDNGEAKVSEQYVGCVVAVVAGAPTEHGYDRPTWTQELLILVCARETGILISTTTMSRLLAGLGVRRGRPKPTVGCPWHEARKTRRLNELRRLQEECPANEVVVFVDEVDIDLNPKIGPDWMLRGQQKEVPTPGKNQKRYLAGALNHRTGRLDWVEASSKASVLFIALIDHLLRVYRRKKVIHVILDNYKIHSSQMVEAAARRWGARVVRHFLPPYCPDHNRIERVWKDVHDNVTRNHTCRDMDHLMATVRHYLEQRKTGRHDYPQAA